MATMKKRSKSLDEYRFNIEVFKDKKDKEYKATNIPISSLDDVFEQLKSKYG
jgi:hypothetical protein